MQTKANMVFIPALAAMLIVAACANSAPEPAATGQGDRLATDFELSVYQGKDILGGDTVKFSHVLAQGKPVVLNFWAGLCPPCRAEMPDLEQVYGEQEGRTIFLGLDVGPFFNLGSREAGKALLQELEITYPAGTTFDAAVIRDYRILGMPTTFFIKPNGEVVRQWTGLITLEKTRELVTELGAASGDRKPRVRSSGK